MNMKITEEEINKLKNIRAQTELIKKEFGEITILELHLKTRKEQAINYLDKLKESESTISKELEEKYGKVRIDTETGEITPLV